MTASGGSSSSRWAGSGHRSAAFSMSRRRVGWLAAFMFASALIIIASSMNGLFADGPAHVAAVLQDEEAREYVAVPRGGHVVPLKSSVTLIANEPDNMTAELLLEEQRQLVGEEMAGFVYPNGRYNISASTLEDLVPEKGGDPVRSVVITTWRSGSTFLGELLNSQPGNFYHYEPLLPLDIVQVGDKSPLADSSITSLRKLLHCNYTGMEESYLLYGRDHNFLMTHNTRLWDSCGPSHELCWDPSFLSRACRIYPFQSMKVVRLRLRLASRLLEDKSLNVRMVLLVRDPRGTMQSRRHREWCPPSPDCSDPRHLCADLVEDYWTAVELLKEYPDKFRVLRYEELSLNPTAMTEDLFEFFGLAQEAEEKSGAPPEEKNSPPLHPFIVQFLETHTKADQGGVSSTHRDSRSAPFRWRKELTLSEIATIQTSCKEAMHLWGYKELAIKRFSNLARGGSLKGQQDLDNFNPLMNLVMT
ncbi:carbohydrate sulfotransferase 5-like [Ischnura elegans]|uniref:carbohydrate sulfotransferase 5-like n=1 Tax=Ischnura elegans TaxID=197161 RepID=UPI001ED86A66|nr:carbohydrate sulfotransferase 5-like [Ischnura elegans]